MRARIVDCGLVQRLAGQQRVVPAAALQAGAAQGEVGPRGHHGSGARQARAGRLDADRHLQQHEREAAARRVACDGNGIEAVFEQAAVRGPCILDRRRIGMFGRESVVAMKTAARARLAFWLAKWRYARADPKA